MNRFLHMLSTVAAGVWLGGMVLIGPIVAMNTFRIMRTIDVANPDAAAGKIMAVNFSHFDKLQLVCAGMLLVCQGIAALTARPKRGPVFRLVLAILASGTLFYSVQFITPKIEALQSQVTAAGAETDVRKTFDEFHESSVMIAKINLALVTAILICLGWSGPPRTNSVREGDAAVTRGGER